ncbi:MAG: glutamate racemase, partial [Oscillospiraceae bacterium]
MNNDAIGVFDSGIGGLTAVKELNKLLPNENIVYFGDTARIPYGTRSKETILKYAYQDINFLKKHNVKMIIAACGTVSSILAPQTVDIGIP